MKIIKHDIDRNKILPYLNQIKNCIYLEVGVLRGKIRIKYNQ